METIIYYNGMKLLFHESISAKEFFRINSLTIDDFDDFMKMELFYESVRSNYFHEKEFFEKLREVEQQEEEDY